MGDKPRAELLGALASLYQSRDYSDLIVFAKDGSRHPVHRAIVCPRSRYFYTAVREGQWKEGMDGHISLADEEPEVIRLMLEYMYLLDYIPHPQDVSSDDEADEEHSTPPSSSRADSSDSVSTLSRDPAQYGNIYGASAISSFGGPHHHHQSHLHPHQASTYSNPTGLYLSRSRTESQLTVHALPLEYHGNFSRPQNPTSSSTRPPEISPLATSSPDLTLHALMYAAGRKYAIDGLSALALDKFKIQLTRDWDAPELAEAIHVVYTSTAARDKEMRETVADALGWGEGLLEKPEIEVAVLEIDGLAYELLKRIRRRGDVGGF